MNKIKFCILDVYPNDNFRICKDTAGGYGTGNNFGSSFFSKILNIFTATQIHQPTMGIGYLMSILKSEKSEIHYTHDQNSNEIKDSDFVILNSSIVAHETELKALKFLHTLNKKTFVIGIFSTIKKEEYLEYDPILIEGEAEKFFMTEDMSFENLNKFFKYDNRVVKVGFVDNLDDLPFPDWETYTKIHKLKNNFLNFDNRTAIPILATRGCPYSCFHYCTYPLQQGRKVRARTPENIVSEIEYWCKKIRNPKFIFRDPVFSINRKHTVALCNLLIEKNIKVDFLVETHLKNLDNELMDLLKKAGLKLVYVGVESKHTDVLANINRATITQDDQYETIKKLEEKDIFVKSMFMIGNPEDNEDKIKETIDYSVELKNTLAQFSVFTPYPGTPVFKSFEDIVTAQKFEDYNQYNLVFKHKYLDTQKVSKLKSLAYSRFYLRINSTKFLFLFIKNFFSNFLLFNNK
jgi:anaerobic magnesium-protoporphyrin IX monomethyl ester cyclase